MRMTDQGMEGRGSNAGSLGRGSVTSSGKRASGWPALRQRVLSALILVPPVILVVMLGWPWFEIMVAVGAAVMAWEWSTVCCGRRGGLGILLMALMAVMPLLAPPLGPWALLVPLIGVLPALHRGDVERRRPLWIAVGSLYIGVPILALTWIRTDAGWAMVLWLFLVVWTTDVFAYVFGRSIGGPLLWPRISPNKTWAGLIGGVGSAGVLGGVAGLALGTAQGAVGAGVAVALGVLLGLVSQAGDLVESAFKRRFRVKDSGDLIPGHGGLLDRVDGLVVAAAALALVLLTTDDPMMGGLLKGGGITSW